MGPITDLDNAGFVTSEYVAVIQCFIDIDVRVLTANCQKTTICNNRLYMYLGLYM